MPTQATRGAHEASLGGNRSRGVPPVPSPLRSNYLGGGKPAPSVEQHLAPLGVRRMAFAVAVLLFVAAFCLGLWVTLWLLSNGLFIVALASLCALLLVGGVVEKSRNKNAVR